MLVPLIGQENFWPEAFPLTEPEYFLGRLPSSAILSTNDSVSRQHARLVFYQDQWFVEDLGSRNGTLLDGQPITSTILGDGQILKTGDHIFAFTLQNEENFDADSFAQWVAGMRERAALITQKNEIPTTAPLPVPLPPVEPTAKPPAPVLTNTMSLSASPVTRAYPPRQPQKSGKVSAILHLPGTASATVSSGPGAGAPASAPVMVPSSSSHSPTSLKVTGPDYLWYAVIVLAAVGVILALVVFFVRRSRENSKVGSESRPAAIEYVLAHQTDRAIG